ncbi:hypothetical protein [Janibacter sp. G1551]|uniref:hypothetical protein n=1 Tax=Janibacter sp. G1551 TaxID=3420440 RepID=UPI003D08857B
MKEPLRPPTGRDATPLISPLLVGIALLAIVAGLVAFAGSTRSATYFAWPFTSQVSSALMGAGLLGVVPMMFSAAVRPHWEGVRIAVLPAGVLVATMAVLAVVHRGDLALDGGPVVAVVLAWGWLLAMVALTVAILVVLVAQSREPGFPLARTAPLPRWALPLVAVLGSAFFGLGVGLLGGTTFWAAVIPWETSTLDARALGAWALTLGVALLQALAEDDLERVRPGLYAIVLMGFLGLVGLVWHAGEIDWATWGAASIVALLAGLLTTGLVGLALAQRASVASAIVAEPTTRVPS